MKVVRLSPETRTSIVEFDSEGAGSLAVADGHGAAHIYFVDFDAGGIIGPHEAGFGQLFIPIVGSGWVAGEDGERVAVSPGQAGYISRGEVHSKGSHDGMTALMIQVDDLTIAEPVLGPAE